MLGHIVHIFIANLRTLHYKVQNDPASKVLACSGLDLVEVCVCDNVAYGVLEPSMSKVKMNQFATEASITILRIDDLIRLAPKEGEGEQ